jgi:predicted ATP-grasp superfamily ATP-dependent carboligase
MNKRKFQELSAIEDWPSPKTWEINNKDELLSCLEDLVYPCILKPQIKNSAFRKYGPKKAFKILNEDELIDVYEIVAQWEKEVVIQEWIKGGDDRVGFCLTYWTRNSEPLVMFAGRKLRQFPIECGCTAIAEPVPKEWQDLIISLTQKIWRKVEFKGLGSIEFKLRPDTNTPVIMEPTVGRTNLQNELAVINGYNIPAIAYFDLIGHNYKPLRSPSKPVKLIDGMAELKAALEYRRKGELGFVQWLNDRSGKKKYMLYRENDLGPFVASVTIGIYNFMKKLVRKMIKLI